MSCRAYVEVPGNPNVRHTKAYWGPIQVCNCSPSILNHRLALSVLGFNKMLRGACPRTCRHLPLCSTWTVFFVWAPLPFKTGRVHQLEGNANERSGQTPSAKSSRNPRKEATEESATDNTQSLAHCQFISSLYTTRFGHQNQHSTLWLWLLSRVIRISFICHGCIAKRWTHFAARYVIARCPAYPP